MRILKQINQQEKIIDDNNTIRIVESLDNEEKIVNNEIPYELLENLNELIIVIY